MMNLKKKMYEVYECRVNDLLVYIGSGVEGRHKHCDSGLSHNYELNKAHFDKDCVVITKVIKKFDNKEDSLILEKELILVENPKFNKVFVNDTRQDCAKHMRDFRNYVKDKIQTNRATGNFKQKCLQVLDEFCEVHVYQSLCEKGFYLNSYFWYDKRGYEVMKKCVNTSRKSDINYASFMLNLLEESCNIHFSRQNR